MSKEVPYATVTTTTSSTMSVAELNGANAVMVDGIVYPKGSLERLNMVNPYRSPSMSTPASRKRRKLERQNRKKGRR